MDVSADLIGELAAHALAPSSGDAKQFRVDGKATQGSIMQAASGSSNSKQPADDEKPTATTTWAGVDLAIVGSGMPASTPTGVAAAARLKWCGCSASSSCSHFTSYNCNAGSTGHWNHPHQSPMPSFWLPSTTLPYSSQSTPSMHHHPYPGLKLNPLQQILSSQHEAKQLSKLKSHILAHPMFDQLLSAHVSCLRVATPIDHLQSIEAQLYTNINQVASRYKSCLMVEPLLQCQEEKEELDGFMANYIVFLHSFKEQLHEHVRVQAMDAIMSCWEIEKAFVNLTGISPEEGSEATMSDDEEDTRSCRSFFDNITCLDYLEGMDSLGLGPLLPTESERSLMERVRLELKSELKQGYRNRIADVREEILRKRRAGKLPSETTAILKKWWNAHSKWPYPTEDEKARLVQETGLELKQINNWFINQRKRNWHSHASNSSSTLLKNEASSSSAHSSNISLSLNCEREKVQSLSQVATPPTNSSFGETA